MSFINLTPHDITVFKEEQFEGLVQERPTVWKADKVCGESLLRIKSSGEVRIDTKTETLPSLGGVPMLKTEYGDLSGIPEDIEIEDQDVLIVSLPTKSNAQQSQHPLAGQMVSPYGVVRAKENGSLVLGCMGFTY